MAEVADHQRDIDGQLFGEPCRSAVECAVLSRHLTKQWLARTCRADLCRCERLSLVVVPQQSQHGCTIQLTLSVKYDANSSKM